VIISEGHTTLLFYIFGRDCMVVELKATRVIVSITTDVVSSTGSWQGVHDKLICAKVSQ
jgi:hypothetical protein